MQVGTVLTWLITAAVSRLRSTEHLHTVPHVVVTLAEHANLGPFVALVALVGLCLALLRCSHRGPDLAWRLLACKPCCHVSAVDSHEDAKSLSEA